MRIACISDTHEEHEALALPPCDLLIHAGDMTYLGARPALQAFDEWCAGLPLPRERILVCAGNHELTLEREPWLADEAFLHSTYLLDQALEVEGIKFYASPWQPRFCDWAFNLDRGGEELRRKWAAIPDDTEVLITHGPPRGCGDTNSQGEPTGCELLLERLWQIRPKLHVCGHIHEAYGEYPTPFGTKVVNASTCDAAYRPVNPPIVVDLEV